MYRTHRLPLWSIGQSSWLQIQRSGFDSRHYQIFWEVVGLERGTLSLLSTIEELLERKSSSFSLEIREYGHRDLSRWPHGTLFPQRLAQTLSKSSGRSVSIVCSSTQATEFSFKGHILHLTVHWLSSLILCNWHAKYLQYHVTDSYVSSANIKRYCTTCCICCACVMFHMAKLHV
jgi:hypothetical protein